MKKLLLLLILVPSIVSASLTFGGASSDKSSHPNSTSLNNLTAFTYIAWIYPTADFCRKMIISKATTIANFKHIMGQGTCSGDVVFSLNMAVGRATTGAETGTVVNSYVLNKWQLIAGTYNEVLTAPIRMYLGSLTSPAKELGYQFRTNGSGATTAEGGLPLTIGNTSAALPTSAFLGQIAVVGVWNRDLSLAEIRQFQYSLIPPPGLVLLTFPGINGTSIVSDFSGKGNYGTTTGVTFSTRNVPLSYLRR